MRYIHVVCTSLLYDLYVVYTYSYQVHRRTLKLATIHGYCQLLRYTYTGTTKTGSLDLVICITYSQRPPAWFRSVVHYHQTLNLSLSLRSYTPYHIILPLTVYPVTSGLIHGRSLARHIERHVVQQSLKIFQPYIKQPEITVFGYMYICVSRMGRASMAILDSTYPVL